MFATWPLGRARGWPESQGRMSSQSLCIIKKFKVEKGTMGFSKEEHCVEDGQVRENIGNAEKGPGMFTCQVGNLKGRSRVLGGAN